MKPIGIDTARLGEGRGDGTNVPFVHPTCPGAKIYITHADLVEMVRGGEEFDREQTKVTREGYGHARIRCERPVEAWKGVAGHVVYAGLCRSCSGVEADNRSMLRDRQASRRGDRREAAE